MAKTKNEIRLEQERLIRLHGMIAPQLKKYPNVDHVGVGIKEVGGELTDEICYRVYVRKKEPASTLSSEEVIPQKIMGIKTDILLKQELHKVEDFDRYRPLRGGVMLRNQRYEHEGKVLRGAGTLGLIVNHTASGELKGLTCHHVVDDGVHDPGNVNATGISIGQPRYIKCCCCCTYNEIGTVHSALKNATVDCALVDLEEDIRNDITDGDDDFTNRIEGLGDVVGVAQAVCCELVHKRGAKTLVTHGQVIDVLYEGSQLLIRSNDANPFADFGDSGSVIINDSNEVVGLLWAAIRSDQDLAGTANPRQIPFTRNHGVANHIGPVMTALGFTIAGAAVGSLAVPASSCSSSCGPISSSSSSGVSSSSSSSSSSSGSSGSSSSSSSASSGSSSSSASPVIEILPDWNAWPGGQSVIALNPTETFTSKDFDLSGKCDWDVSNGGTNGIIIETGGTTASDLKSITVRYDTHSANKTSSKAVWVECIKNGELKRIRRTVFKITSEGVNASSSLHAQSDLEFNNADEGTDTKEAGFLNPGQQGATRYVGKIEVIWSILPVDIPWNSRDIDFLWSHKGSDDSAEGEKWQCVLRRENTYSYGSQDLLGDNRLHEYNALKNDGEVDTSDGQYPTSAKPNFFFRNDAPGFSPVGLTQAYLRANFREFIEFYNGEEWVKVTDYTPWFCNITADQPTAVPDAPTGIGAGETNENIPNSKPSVNAGANQTVETNEEVTLKATATDPENDQILNFKWTQTSGTNVTLSNGGNSPEVTFMSPASAGDLTFSIVVEANTKGLPRTNAADHESDSDAITITVEEPPPPPDD